MSLQSAGGTLLDTLIDMQFTLYDTTDASVWMETHIDVEVVAGIYNLRLGSFSSLSQITFDQPYDLGITLGDDPEIDPRTPFDSSPYALSSVCPDPTCSDLSLISCTSGCSDLDTDNANCGACDVPCPSGNRCIGGSCWLSCQAGLSNCGGVCVNRTNDNANCGSCGGSCATGEKCSGSSCSLSCQVGLTVCSGVCVNLATDNAHCGTCTTVCAAGFKCSESEWLVVTTIVGLEDSHQMASFRLVKRNRAFTQAPCPGLL